MDRKQLEQLIKESLEASQDQRVKAQIREAIVSTLGGEDQVAEDIDHPEKVEDPDGDKVHADVMTSLDEAKLAAKVRSFVKGGEEEILFAPHFKEHMQDSRNELNETLMSRWCKGKKKGSK